MENTVKPAAVSAAPNVVYKSDMRPTADAAAIARDPQPDIPLPLAASMGPVAAVNQSRITTDAPKDVVDLVLRTLKPYGVKMLPDDPSAPENPQPHKPDDAR
jgi:hypothetical protein